jgi:hypothetical protein
MNIEDFWKPFEVEISDFDTLVAEVDKVMNKAMEGETQFAWRGQVNAGWALHSSLYRGLSLTKGKSLSEAELAREEGEILVNLHRWGLHSSMSSGRLSVLNQLAMLQHYGAPTRLIDISFNAWVGAWFAVEEKWDNGVPVNEDQDARLFAFDVTDRLINENEDLRKWEDQLGRPWKDEDDGFITKKEWTTSVFAWKPSSLDLRISAQNGGFLFGGVPASVKPDGNKFQFPKSPNYKDGSWHLKDGKEACCLAMRPHVFDSSNRQLAEGALYTFRIKASAKKDIRERLEKIFGYSHSTIYPDYTGFSSFGTPHLRKY